MVPKKLILICAMSLMSIALITGCGSGGPGDTTPPVNLLKNSSVELGTGNTPDVWEYFPTINAIEWASVGKTGTRSLKIISNGSITKPGFYWVQTFTTDIPIGKKPVLKVFIKGEGLSDNAVAIAIRGDVTPTSSGDSEYWNTSQGVQNISGTFEWTEYTLVASTPVPAGIKSVTIFLLLLPNAQGTVYFDDIQLYDHQ